MAAAPILQLKSWFSKTLKPTQEQFWAWMDSYWHKSEQIPAGSITGLPTSLPADGGDADTVGGKKPSDLVESGSNNLITSGGVWSWFGAALSDLKTTSKTVISAINELLDGKANKVPSATAGNLAALDASGNPIDSGAKATDFISLGEDGKVKPSQLPPKPLLLSVPPKITVTEGNTVRQRIPFKVLPEGVKQNIIFQCFDLEAIRFSGDGSFTAKAVGTSEVWVTPTENADERKVVTVEVVLPKLRIAGSSLRLAGSKLRTT